MLKKKVVYHEEKSYINKETGEIIEETKTIKKRVNAEEFMQVYLSDISGLLGVENKSQMFVLIELWKLAQFDTNQVVIIKGIKQQIANNIGIAYKTVDNHIVKLCKLDLLIRKETGIYYLNPNYFFKGYSVNRPKVIKLVLEYRTGDKSPLYGD